MQYSDCEKLFGPYLSKYVAKVIMAVTKGISDCY